MIDEERQKQVLFSYRMGTDRLILTGKIAQEMRCANKAISLGKGPLHIGSFSYTLEEAAEDALMLTRSNGVTEVSGVFEPISGVYQMGVGGAIKLIHEFRTQQTPGESREWQMRRRKPRHLPTQITALLCAHKLSEQVVRLSEVGEIYHGLLEASHPEKGGFILRTDGEVVPNRKQKGRYRYGQVKNFTYIVAGWASEGRLNVEEIWIYYCNPLTLDEALFDSNGEQLNE